MINTADTFLFSGPLQRGLTYYYKVLPRNATGVASGCTQNLFASEPYAYGFRFKFFIEGLYDKTNHRMFAAVDPVLHDTIADTVTVCLAAAAAPHAILYTSKVPISTLGIAYAQFPQPALLQTYYLVIRQRNSLETWSNTQFSYNTPDTNYNFSDAQSRAFGSNQILLETGVYGIHTGDVNQNGAIEITDISAWESGSAILNHGYVKEDLNGDQMAESADYSFLEDKVVLNITVLKP